ncbi:MAG: glutamate-1-semialdehyde 2,1-aminomutase [Litorilinea sp.]
MIREQTRNQELVARAQAVIPGGVNSINRLLPWPFVPETANGAYVTDVDGTQYLDYHAAFGPIILGHNDPAVNAAVQTAMQGVDIFGAGVTELEILLAEKIVEHVPSAERVMLTNSGSEATYAALRLARAVTGGEKIIKFQGTYHGWHDAVLMNIITPPERMGQQDLLSAGMSRGVVDNTIVLPFNDAQAVEAAVAEHGGNIAAILVEIIPHNIGCVLPHRDFLQTLRRLADETGILLIFDEVITGFRHDLGGYQRLAGVTPDITTFAKAMANGYPIAAIAGAAKFMDRFGPGGGVFFAGTYNGHPFSVAAALATIARLEDGSVYAHCFDLADQAKTGLETIAQEFGIPICVARFGSVFVPYFMSERHIDSYDDLLDNNTARDVWFRNAMCEQGIFMLPTALKRNHVSAAHTQADIDRTLETARAILKIMPAA